MTKLLILFALYATSLSAQSASAADSLAVRRLLDSARALGLPSDPLVGLVQEGRQRGASPARVLSALRDYVGALDRAKRALGARASDAEVDAGAGVLLSGANVSTITALRKARPSGNITTSLVVLADLVVRGVPLTQAEDALVTLTRVGASDAALHEFRIGVQRDLDAGQGAETSLIKRTRETVLRFQPGQRKPPPGARLDEVTLMSTSSGVPPQTISRALASAIEPDGGTLAQVRGSATPFGGLPQLQLRGTVDGGFEAQRGTGRAGGELMTQFGSTNPRFGAAFGVGASTASAGVRRAPIGYGASWYSWRTGAARVEWRGARLSAKRAGVFTDGNALTATALRASATTADTGETTPPPPISGSSNPDSSNVSNSESPNAISDFRFELTQRIGRFSIEGATGLRVLGSQPLDTWAAVNVATWFNPSFAIVSGWSGRRVINGAELPGPMSLILGVRWRPDGRDLRARTGKSYETHAAGVVHQIGNGVELIVTSASAHRVEISGDFTEWLPVDMTRLDAKRWRVALPSDRTLVRLRVRIDGGVWVVPDGLPKARSAFGEELGTIVLVHEAGQ